MRARQGFGEVRRGRHKYATPGMLICMRTTIDINDVLFRAAKRKAAERGTSLREVVEAALRQHLGRTKPSAGYALRWQPESGRLQPGVDLANRDALFDLMDGRR